MQTSSVIAIENGNVQFDPDTTAGLPANERSSVELAVIGFSNFISGTYIQDSSDVTNVKSTLTINSGQVLRTSFALLNSLPSDSGASFVDYGTTVTGTGGELVITGKSALNKDDDTGAVTVTNGASRWFANLRVWQGDDTNVLDGTNVKKSQGMGAVLVQAAGAALFKSLGKTAAINNDNNVEGRGRILANKITNELQETDASYTDSTFFKRYLDSGRYAEDNGDTDGTVTYNLKNANFDFMVKLTGTVSDPEDTVNSTLLQRVLGVSGTDHKVAEANALYTMNIFMRLQQRDDL